MPYSVSIYAAQLSAKLQPHQSLLFALYEPLLPAHLRPLEAAFMSTYYAAVAAAEQPAINAAHGSAICLSI